MLKRFPALLLLLVLVLLPVLRAEITADIPPRPQAPNDEAAYRTLPAKGQCETADVRAVLTVSPGEVFAIDTTGELCSHFVDGTPTLTAYFGRKEVTYAGLRKRARVSDGIIGFRHSFLGAQGSVGLSVRW